MIRSRIMLLDFSAWDRFQHDRRPSRPGSCRVRLPHRRSPTRIDVSSTWIEATRDLDRCLLDLDRRDNDQLGGGVSPPNYVLFLVELGIVRFRHVSTQLVSRGIIATARTTHAEGDPLLLIVVAITAGDSWPSAQRAAPVLVGSRRVI